MIIQGRVTKVEVKQGVSERTGNSWRRVEFVVEFKEYPTDRYYDHVKLESFNDKVIENIKVDMMVKATISHRVSTYNDKTFNEIVLNEVHAVKDQAQVAGEQYAIAANMAEQHDNVSAAHNVPTAEPAEKPDDLPF